MTEHVPILYRDPFTIGSPNISKLRPGMSISEMVMRMPYLPKDFSETGEIRINGDLVPRDMWALVKPKATREDRPINVTFHAAIRGGGDDGGKSGVAMIASLAITIAAVAVSGGILGPTGAIGGLGPAFGVGGTGALIAGSAISLGEGLLLTALSPPEATP